MLKAIGNMLDTRVHSTICTGDQTLTVKESESLSKIKKLHIQGIPENAFAFTLDYKAKNSHCFQQLSCYLNKKTEKINKGCDLVLMVSSENKIVQIVILDLKSDRLNKEDVKQQLVNSELYVRYLLSMAKEFYPVDVEEYNFIKVIVTTSNRHTKKATTYRPNEFKKSDHFKSVFVQPKNEEAYVYLNQLLGRHYDFH